MESGEQRRAVDLRRSTIGIGYRMHRKRIIGRASLLTGEREKQIGTVGYEGLDPTAGRNPAAGPRDKV